MVAAPATLTLKLKESLPKDVGRAIGRLDPEDMKQLGVEAGDILELSGKRKTVAKAMPSYTDDRGNRSLQTDGLVRENVGASLDDTITIRKAAARPAEKLTLTPLTAIGALQKDAKLLGSLIQGTPVTQGDRIRATLFGSKSIDFRVSATSPAGIVVIGAGTSVKLETAAQKGSDPSGAKITYEDIGGLGNQIRRVREMIELPLRFPEVFERLGIRAPKGVLLYGPPGTGKTLIARAVAGETDAHFISVSGPEVMGKLYGESEGRLRSIFEDAKKHAPAIIFIDEIDAIAPKREEIGSEKQVEKRVVAQLLSLMDGLESRGQVIVIGATNIPNAIDPALRRPGRFDREISIAIPDKTGRAEILQIHTRGMPLTENVSLDHLAAITHGFVGADLESLAREAAMSALRRVLPELNLSDAEIPYEMLRSLEVSMENFMEALREVEPSAIREFFVEVPDVKWHEVGGLDAVKEELKEAVEWPLKHAAVFKAAGALPPKGILLYGPPGTGKTMLAKAVASETGVNFISVKGPSLMSRFIGESEKAIREIFKVARQAAPSVLFFDEIDAVIPRRNHAGSDVMERVVSQFLVEMDGIEKLTGVVVLAATNRIDLIDPAMLRGGRFELLLEVPPPDHQTRHRIVEIHTSRNLLDTALDTLWIAGETDGWTGADIEALCRKAASLAVRSSITRGKMPPVIMREHFEIALALAQKQRSLK